MLQFKATVWPKVASESTYEAQNFLGEHLPDPPPPQLLLHSVLQAAESWAGPGYEDTRKHSVPTLCPGIGCVLATPLLPGQMCNITETTNLTRNADLYASV